jgi:hypothetical protein
MQTGAVGNITLPAYRFVCVEGRNPSEPQYGGGTAIGPGRIGFGMFSIDELELAVRALQEVIRR